MTIALYELTAGYKALADLESSDEDLLTALAQVGDAINAKVENVCKVLRNLEAGANALKIEARRMGDAARTVDNRIDALKSYLLANVSDAGLKRAGGDILYVTLQLSPPSAKVVDEEAVSEAEGFKVAITTWRYDNRRAIEAWKATGQAPAGFAVTQGTHLVIRP